jgi:acyl-CoA synthetase (AMP-forming)/AMP-acid ligase II
MTIATGLINRFLDIARSRADTTALTVLDAAETSQPRWTYRELLNLMERRATYPGKRRVGSVGSILSDKVRIAVVNAEGDALPSGTAGEIVIHGATLFEGFLHRPDETAALVRNGWFYKGDIGYQDEEGFLLFLGRSQAITKIASQMVDLVEVKNALSRPPGVAKSPVTVSRSPGMSESLSASIVPASDVYPADLNSALKMNSRNFTVRLQGSTGVHNPSTGCGDARGRRSD